MLTELPTAQRRPGTTARTVVKSDRLYPQQYMAADTKPPPEALRQESAVYLGSEDISADRFISPAFHEREVERVWPKVWQVACHESELAEVGDTVVYDIVNWSFLLVRSEPDTIKAFYNSCLHRGTQLRCKDGPVSEIRCPFHGWAYGLDGALADLPEPWDFPQVNRATTKLPEVQVATWAGWVFINMDPDAAPLTDYLGSVAKQFEEIRPFRRHVETHAVITGIQCNWKVLQDAFLEVYHCEQTHPQLMIATDCYDAECSVYPDAGHMSSRMIVPIAVPGAGGHYQVTEQDVMDNLFQDRVQGAEIPKLEPGEIARPQAVQVVRKLKEEALGIGLSEASDAEVIDAMEYFAFPNFMPWAGYQNCMGYRFRPNGNDHLSSIMDVWLLNPVPEGQDPASLPHAPEPILVPASEGVSGVAELGRFQVVLQQDLDNLPKAQRGLMTSKKGAITLGNYQEVRVRNFHQMLDGYLKVDGS